MPFDGLSDWGNSSDDPSKLWVCAVLAGWKPIDHRTPTFPFWKTVVVEIFIKLVRSYRPSVA